MEHATIGNRIRHYRTAHRLSTMELATRVGVTENAIQKLESGVTKQPSFDVGLRIAAELGVRPEVLVRASNSVRMLPRVLEIIREHQDELKRIKIQHISVFGSVARGEDGPDSDVDLIIAVPAEGFSLFDLAGAGNVLEDLLARRVDLITERAAKRDVRMVGALAEAVHVF
ncbi:MAG: nucleotidyltransferase domain-containing protein [Candidatus Baltobacteraceae bacterium]